MVDMKHSIQSERLLLEPLSPDNISQDYLSWMNDKSLTQYMESRFKEYSLSDLSSYIRQINASKTEYLWGIFCNQNHEYVGNIKLGGINVYHKFGDIGFIIGNRMFWGKGLASEAISMATWFGFNELKLNKIKAGYYRENEGSARCLAKNGYQIVCILKNDRFFNDCFVDCVEVELTHDEWIKQKHEERYCIY